MGNKHSRVRLHNIHGSSCAILTGPATPYSWVLLRNIHGSGYAISTGPAAKYLRVQLRNIYRSSYAIFMGLATPYSRVWLSNIPGLAFMGLAAQTFASSSFGERNGCFYEMILANATSEHLLSWYVECSPYPGGVCVRLTTVVMCT